MLKTGGEWCFPDAVMWCVSVMSGLHLFSKMYSISSAYKCYIIQEYGVSHRAELIKTPQFSINFDIRLLARRESSTSRHQSLRDFNHTQLVGFITVSALETTMFANSEGFEAAHSYLTNLLTILQGCDKPFLNSSILSLARICASLFMNGR